MKRAVSNLVIGCCLIVIAMAIGAAGIYIGETDDAPGAALIGIGIMIGLFTIGIKNLRVR